MSRYIVQVTFHSAHNLPVADLSTLSSDPYIHATLLLPNPSPEQPPPLTFRTPTIHRSRNPEWTIKNGSERAKNSDDSSYKLPSCCRWIISGVEPSGFTLVLRFRDEDPRKHDDKLGRAYVRIPELTDTTELCEKSYEIQKRRAKPTVYMRTYLAALSPVKSRRADRHGYVVVSVKVLGKDECKDNNKVYTLGPCKWSQHFSPLIGALTPGRHSKPQAHPKGKVVSHNGNGVVPDPNTLAPTLSSTSSLSSSQATTSTFIANKFQLAGPVPDQLRHTFVGYATFVEKMFTYDGIRGRLLNKAMHHQYRTIYSHDKATVYGVVPDHESVALQFLKLVDFGRGGRLFTYVITLDGEFRFTETGPEFAVNLLSKHTMHADVTKVIAFSGEFFIRKHIPGRRSSFTAAIEVEEENDDGDDEEQHQQMAQHNPKHYELVIDNDSGTYRPKKELLPVLRDWLDHPSRLGDLGHITAMDGFDEGLKKSKERLQEIKKKNKRGGDGGGTMMMRTGSSASDVGAKPFSKVGIAEKLDPGNKNVTDSGPS